MIIDYLFNNVVKPDDIYGSPLSMYFYNKTGRRLCKSVTRDSLEKGKKSQEDWFKKMLKLEEDNNKVSRSFEELEVYPYMKKKVGSFRKGAVDGMGEITLGSEYIWCKGFKQR